MPDYDVDDYKDRYKDIAFEPVTEERAVELATACRRSYPGNRVGDAPNAALIELLLGIAGIEDEDIRRHTAFRAAETVFICTLESNNAFYRYVESNRGEPHKNAV